MRTRLIALAMVLAACSTSDERGAPAASTVALGPDAIVLRVPAPGGQARAYLYPALDSAIWNTRAALPAQVVSLAFNIDAGVLAFRDSAGMAWRLTLGGGQVERAFPTALGTAVSLDGSTIFGTSEEAVIRLSSTERTPWRVSTAATLSQLQPLRDGGVLLIGQRGAETVLTRFRPPATTAVDSAVLPGSARLISAAGGDRYYLSDGPRSLVSVRARDLEKLSTVSLGDSIIATTTSPSGDRVYVLGRDGDAAQLQVINKYSDEIVATVPMPTSVTALRMDPLGRSLLVRHGGESDSVLVIGIATNAILGRFASPWRADLPLVFPDGRLGTLRDDDVVVLSADRFQAMAVVPGGAKDIWTVVQWNGFRRRAGDAPLRATATQPDTITRRARDTTRARNVPDSAPRAADSVVRTGGDSIARRLSRLDSLRRAMVRPETQPRPRQAAPSVAAQLGERGSFVVQFAALKVERTAQQLASSIKANGEKAHVVMTTSNGTALYRVILGPFRSRSDAEQAGQAAGRDYWVFEGGTN